MAQQQLKLQRVAVIGAGVSGVAAAVHLKREGLDVTVYERNARAGGIWYEFHHCTFPNSLTVLLNSLQDIR